MKLLLKFVFLILCTAKVNGQCRRSEFRCENGNCILFEDQCDGKVDCTDGSDETVTACARIECPYGFRCSYGACINKRAECDGHKDCADNSDEVSANCKGAITALTIKGNCSYLEFQCKSNECLPLDELCDGKPNCADHSDETVERCQSTYCPPYGFRCAYGACINGFKKCNGIQDCVDGSDESASVCGTPTDTVIVYETDDDDKSCVINYIPENGRVVFEHDITIEKFLNDRIDQFQNILYICNESNETTRNVCQNGEWLVPGMPTCKRYCSGLTLQHPTIKSTCEYKSQTILCGDRLNPGTTATISCQFGYRKPNEYVQPNIICQPDGKWNFPAYQCEQVCGTGPEYGVKYSHGGEVTSIVQVPWAAAIYNNIQVPGQFTQICGGTILSPNVIITAAHCLWDTQDRIIYNESHFMVGVGKSRRSYYDAESLVAQLIPVQKIATNPEYADATGLYLADIALLLLKEYITFRFYVKPICLEFNIINADLTLPPNTVGKVAGWGIEQTGQPSPVLKSIDIPYVDFTTCTQAASETFKRFIVSDKFCGGYVNLGLSVCRGDSGGGWVYAKEENGTTTYYLRGIVSNGENLNSDCDPNKYSAFTSVEFYFPWILEKLASFSPNVIQATRRNHN